MDINFLYRFLEKTAKIMQEHKDYLIELDQSMGDGDLGLTMSDGFEAAAKAGSLALDQDASKLLYQAGKAMSQAVPSTMGTLMASGLMEAGKQLRGQELSLALVFEAYQEGVMKRGKAKLGEKTFLDGFVPGTVALRANEAKPIKEASKIALAAAKAGFEASKEMLAKHGRAAMRGEASKGEADPGAAVAVLIFQALVQASEEE